MLTSDLVATADVSRIEAPVTIKAYMMCAFAAFGGIFFGYDTGWMGGVLGMPYFIAQYTDNKLTPGINANNLPATFAITASNKSLVTSILSAGTFFGALIAVSLPGLSPAFVLEYPTQGAY